MKTGDGYVSVKKRNRIKWYDAFFEKKIANNR